jgi:hypothetical protein
VTQSIRLVLLTLLAASAVLLPASVEAAPCPRMLKAMEQGEHEDAVERGEKCVERFRDPDKYPEGFLESLQQAWLDRARQRDTIEAMVEVQQRFPGSEVAEQASRREEELAWEHARADDSRAAYETHRAAYPDGPHAVEALQLEGARAFAEVEAGPTIELWRGFRTRYAEHALATEAFTREGELAFEVAAGQGGVEAWAGFVADYADHDRVGEARERMEAAAFEDAVASVEPEALRRFLDRYPGGAHGDEARWLAFVRGAQVRLSSGDETVELRATPGDEHPQIRQIEEGSTLSVSWPMWALPDPELPSVRVEALRDDGGSVGLDDCLGALIGRPGLWDQDDLAVLLEGALTLGSEAGALEVGLEVPLRAGLPCSEGSLTGLAFLVAPPAGLQAEELRFPVVLSRLVEPRLLSSALLLYRKGDALYVVDAATSQAPARLADLPAETRRWSFQEGGTSVLALGSKGALVADLATGRTLVDFSWGESVSTVHRWHGGWVVHLDRIGKHHFAEDSALVVVRDGSEVREDLVPFGEGTIRKVLVNDRFVAFEFSRPRESWEWQVADLRGKERPQKLDIDTGSVALVPEGSTAAIVPRDGQPRLIGVDLETGARSTLWAGRRDPEAYDGVIWPAGAPGPIVRHQAYPGSGDVHYLLPLSGGGPKRLTEAQAHALKKGEPEPSARPRDQATGVAAVDYEIHSKDVGDTPEVFAKDPRTGREVQISSTASYRSEKRCDQGERVRALGYGLAPTGEHVLYIAYRSGCDGTYGPTFISRLDGVGGQVELGTGDSVPSVADIPWSPGFGYLLIGKNGSLNVYSATGEVRTLDDDVKGARWYAPPLQVLMARDL